MRVQPVPFIDRHDKCASLFSNIPGKAGILFTDLLLGIQHQYHHMCSINCLQCLDDTELLNHFPDPCPATHTGGINQGIGDLVSLERYKDTVAGGTGQIVGQHPLLAHDAVNQCGLANIGPADHGDTDAVVIF